jgi:hypothetical protein
MNVYFDIFMRLDISLAYRVGLGGSALHLQIAQPARSHRPVIGNHCRLWRSASCPIRSLTSINPHLYNYQMPHSGACGDTWWLSVRGRITILIPESYSHLWLCLCGPGTCCLMRDGQIPSQITPGARDTLGSRRMALHVGRSKHLQRL